VKRSLTILALLVVVGLLVYGLTLRHLRGSTPTAKPSASSSTTSNSTGETLDPPSDSVSNAEHVEASAAEVVGTSANQAAPPEAQASTTSAITVNETAKLRAVLNQAYQASDARSALRALASVPASVETRAIERSIEELCFVRTDERRRRAARSSWRGQQRAKLKDYCSTMPALKGTGEDLERALAVHGPNAFSETSTRVRGNPAPQSEAQLVVRGAQDFASLLAALQYLDEIGQLGVPPHSVDAKAPARLSTLLPEVIGWVLCTERAACGPRSGNTVALCQRSNDCPPDADYATALRMKLSATRFEQAQWLYQQILGMRRN
jgi:hypothetical protein